MLGWVIAFVKEQMGVSIISAADFVTIARSRLPLNFSYLPVSSFTDRCYELSKSDTITSVFKNEEFDLSFISSPVQEVTTQVGSY